MACNFINVAKNPGCKENFSGVGSTIYAFTKDDLSADNKMEYDSTAGAAHLKSTAFQGVTFTPIKVKAKTGKVTATSTPDGGGFTNVYTGRVANDMDSMAYCARVMNNRNDWGLLIPTGAENEYYVLYSDVFDTQFSMESDTGDTPDSDHGHTITVTVGPVKYALPRWSATAALTLSTETTVKWEETEEEGD